MKQVPPHVKLKYKEMRKLFREAETNNNHVTGCIVLSKDSFSEPYSLDSRTYEISSYNKAFRPHMGGYSIFGHSLDSSDPLVRLDNYMADEHGGKDGWKIEYCYMKQDDYTRCNEYESQQEQEDSL